MAFFDKQGKNYFAKQLEIHGIEQYMGLEADSFNCIIIVRQLSYILSKLHTIHIIETLICNYFRY